MAAGVCVRVCVCNRSFTLNSLRILWCPHRTEPEQGLSSFVGLDCEGSEAGWRELGWRAGQRHGRRNPGHPFRLEWT